MSNVKFCQFIFTSGFLLLIIDYFSEKKVLCLSIDFLKNRKNPFFPRDMKILKNRHISIISVKFIIIEFLRKLAHLCKISRTIFLFL